jgi:hypothetical protein
VTADPRQRLRSGNGGKKLSTIQAGGRKHFGGKETIIDLAEFRII